MVILIAGLILFFVPHLLREAGVRDMAIARVGSDGAYKGVYSLITLAGLGLIIWGKASASFIMIWEPYYQLRFISHVLMIPAWILFVAGNMPYSFTRAHLRHPMLGGVALWGFAHLWSNGDLASILLFGSFALWASFKFVKLEAKQALASKKPRIMWDIIALASGLIMYVGVSTYHGQIFGVGLTFV